MRLLVLVGAVAAGAIAACQTVDLGTPPADLNACRPSQLFFVSDIWPKVLGADYSGRHCYDAGCHDAGSARPLMLVPPPASDPGAVPLMGTWAADYISAAEQMNCSNAAASNLLALPTGVRTHGGGMVFAPGSPQALAIQMWPSVQP